MQPSCDGCKTGRYNGCPNVVFFSTPPFHGRPSLVLDLEQVPSIDIVTTYWFRQGTLSRWHLHPAQWLHRLPDHVSFEEGALCEPLAVALAGIERSGLRLGDPALIWCVASLRDIFCYICQVLFVHHFDPVICTVVLDPSAWLPYSQHEQPEQSPLSSQTWSKAVWTLQKRWFRAYIPFSLTRIPNRRSKQLS